MKVAGNPPATKSLTDQGDTAFEVSRALAHAKLGTIIEEARSKRDSARLVEKLYAIKTGERIKTVKIEAIADEWNKIPRHRKPTEKYACECRAGLKRFTAFLRQEFPKVDDLAQVTRTVARAFLDVESRRGVTARTWNSTMQLLRATFKSLLPAGAINPFSDTPTMAMQTMFRKPFTSEELKSIVETARDDDFIRPIIVTGICTAMRRGDCCLLKWKDVDIAQGFITVKTAKTGATVDIPIFPLLEEELIRKTENRRQKAEGYVFPEQARMYLENASGITWRVKKILVVALGGRSHGGVEKGLPEVAKAEARRRGLVFINTLGNAEKRERMRRVFELYMDGKTTKELVEAAGVSKGSTSHYLNEIEMAIGCRIVRGRPLGGSLTARLRNDSDLLRTERDGGRRRASVRDFHSLRVTWVTLALTAGVPLELVQKVTGHKTTNIVLKHYFQPGREAFRVALHEAMPKLLTNTGTMPRRLKAPQEQIQRIAAGMTAKTWKRDQARIAELLAVDMRNPRPYAL